MRHLGLDLGGTNIKLALLEGDELVASGSVPTRSEDGPAAVIERIVALGRETGPFDTVGVSVPGLVDPERGTALLFPNLYGEWGGQPLAEPLSAGLGRPVRLVNDGHAFALAEARLGAARGSRDVVCVVLGTGIGGGLVLDGRLHLGIDERAGELGHHTVLPDGPVCGCGSRGCLEALAGARVIARAAGKASYDDVVEAARRREAASLEALERAGTYIGIAIANLTIFLTPERVVVGGGVAAAGALLLEPIRAEVRRRAAHVAPLEKIELVEASLGSAAGAIGAALYGAAD